MRLKTENIISEVLRNKAVLSKYRLTVSHTEVEFWVYKKGFLAHSRESHRGKSEQPAERREDNLNTLRNTVRRLVNANVGQYGYEPCFLTFTYRENQCDLAVAWSDWHAFMQRMRRRYGKLHALTVAEFQKRGAVHFHCIFFNLPPCVEAEERLTRTIAGLWMHGFVDIERVRSARNVGAYVCKYLDKSVHDDRLRGRKVFFCSVGLLRPQEIRSEDRIDNFLALNNNLVQVRHTEYDSAFFKKIKYTQYANRSTDSELQAF